MKSFLALLKDAALEWWEDRAPQHGAALAFYATLSVAPLLVVAVAVAGFFFGEDAAQGHLLEELRETVGPAGAEAIQGLLVNARRPTAGRVATLLGLGTLLFGATGAFAQLQAALNAVWGVEAKGGRGLLGVVTDRFWTFAMVLTIGFLLLASLALSAILAGLSDFLKTRLGDDLGYDLAYSLHWLDLGISLVLITVLFALIFKVLPNARVAWRDVWVGAALTAALFTAGKLALGWYLGRGAIASAYGAASSFVALLLWIYYSAQILLYGAEFTQVYANRLGSRVVSRSRAADVSA